MDWFTADTHFGHKNIIKHCKRPFLSVDEMNDTLIKNINQKITKSDRLFVVGDFCFRGGSPKYYLERITCKNVILIRGNHDPKNDYVGFKEVHDIYQNTFRGHKIILCHYPLRTWNAAYHGSWHLFGHVHGHLNKQPRNGKSFDVGVDCWNFHPLSIVDVERELS